MAITNIYTGVETADIAKLESGGVTFRCFVWHNIPRQRIEAKVFAETQAGGSVLVTEAIIAIVVGDDNDIVDCPRVLSAGSIFVIHWINTEIGAGGATASLLFRSLYDVTDVATAWVNQGSVDLDTTNLYDHHIVVGSSPEQFIVSRRTAAGIIITTRYQSPFLWTDVVWFTSDGALTIADNVLACYADEPSDTVLVSWQDTLTLQTFRRNASDGGVFVQAETFDDLGLTPVGDNHFTAVTYACVDNGRFMVIVEAITDDDFVVGGNRDFARLVGWREIRGNDATALDHSQWLFNLNLASKAWCRILGTALNLEAYVAVAFKSIADGQEFNQNYVYVIRLDRDALVGVSGPGVIRPIPVSAQMGGDLDARPHGGSPVAVDVSVGARMNHIPFASGSPGYTLGPDLKSITFSIIRWSRLIASQDDDADTELQPIQAGVAGFRFYHEDPWHVRRDPDEPAQPDTPQWRGAAHRSMSRPVEIPTGLVFTGGMTMVYDGQQPVELGFPWAPEILSITASGGGGAMDEPGEYFFVATYEWTDDRGQLHRSPPSTPVLVTLAVNDFATLQVRPANLTMKDDARRYPLAGPVTISIWRTQIIAGTVSLGSGGQSFLLRREFAGATPGFQIEDTPVSNPTVFRQEILAGRPNNITQFNELFYHQLDTATLLYVPPAPTPHTPLTTAASWKNRLFGVDPREPAVVVYSEEILPIGTQNILPEFLDTNRIRFDSRGEITALQSMDYALVAFTPDAIYNIQGQPAAGGVGANLDIQTVVTGIGCVEPRSVILTHLGIFFQSSKGIHLLDRGFTVQYPGGPVEDVIARAGQLRGGVHLVDSHEVRWVFNEEPGSGPLEVRPRILKYDYSVNLWSIDEFVNLGQGSSTSRLNEMQHATAWRGRQGGEQMVILQQNGLALERSRTDTVFSDEGVSATSSVGLDVQTEWFQLGELYRVREFGIQTERINPGGMTVDIFYDTDGTFDETTPGDTYNFPSPAPAYLPIKPRIQKLSGVMLRIRELSPPPTENVRIVDLMIRWMPKQTPRRYARANIGA